MNGRAEIATDLRAIFAHHPTAAYVAKVREVRPIDSKVALLRAVAGMIPPGKTELNPDTNAVQSLLIVLDAGQPKIALLQNTPAAFHGRPHLGEELTAELSEVLRRGVLAPSPPQFSGALAQEGVVHADETGVSDPPRGDP